ncbi:hypothetical protein XVE_1773 [Xanthomonas vesicatoria ATCC 35937]|uniref:Lipoprotein n=1 Tax=Xanthomonas vesicatoria ATCC 35937 TaxID=925775 RepID=F0BCE6_9XANT|nr:hypothetical protein XVE_1773 [Xanthomonas vesicatoria ATCC 35937]
MTQLRTLPLLACLLLGACASHTPKSAPPSASADTSSSTETPVRDDSGVTAQPAAAGFAAPDAVPANVAAASAQPSAAGTDTAGAPTSAEDDFAALYGTATPQAGADGAPAQPGAAPAYDPWERYNRGMHRFNMAGGRGGGGAPAVVGAGTTHRRHRR